MELASVLLVAVLAVVFGALAGGVAGVAVMTRAGPTATPAMLAEVAKIRLEWQSWRTGAEGVLEAMEEVDEVVERKRRRVAARDSEAKRREQREIDAGNSSSDPHAALRARARALGHPV